MATISRELAHAKLTRTLRVTGQRSDGYHLLASEMVAVDLSDELFINEGGVGLEVVDEIAWELSDRARPRLEVPTNDTNLVARALALSGRSAFIRLVKRIPAGAGLGGGSTDAAAVLRYFGALDRERASSLGADVPFCLEGGRALVSGIGESLEPLRDEPLSFVIVTPAFPVSTKAVYDAYDELGHPSGPGDNDLEAAAIAVEPRLVALRRAISEVAGRAPTLAGSGASYFLECHASERATLSAALRVSLANEVNQFVVSACSATDRLMS
ncbi:MAG TPA: 4-(cytidine 5'-diphospho)-2-C-methyl-D-erythritol kinase [Acidimicrobiales bacterium]